MLAVRAVSVSAKRSTSSVVTHNCACCCMKVRRSRISRISRIFRVEKGRPIVRIVDFESSYDVARHSSGEFYSPPTTTGYSAPEVSQQPPNARADVFSLGAVVYTMLAGYHWAASGEPRTRIEADRNLDPELRDILLKAVAPGPDERHESADHFGAALAAYLERIWPGRTW